MTERSSYAVGIATALRHAVGDTRPAIKTIAGWSGADERTAKNWLAQRYGPRGDHLVALMRHSDHILLAVLELAGRQSLAGGSRVFAALANVRKAIREVDARVLMRFMHHCGRITLDDVAPSRVLSYHRNWRRRFSRHASPLRRTGPLSGESDDAARRCKRRK